MSDEDLICNCMVVTRGDIKTAIRQGCHTVDELKATLLCCTGCGTCESRVQKVLDEEKVDTVGSNGKAAS